MRQSHPGTRGPRPPLSLQSQRSPQSTQSSPSPPWPISPLQLAMVPLILMFVLIATLSFAQGWKRWFHLPRRAPGRIVRQPMDRANPPGGMVFRLAEDDRPDTLRRFVKQFRAVTYLMATPSHPLEESRETRLRKLWQTLEEAAIAEFLDNASLTLDFPQLPAQD